MKTGFIYIWYDRKRKMYYIGCHLGFIDDGYICSSKRMRDNYRNRPQDFKRRIIKKDIARENLLSEEHKWLSLIPDKQLGIKYYNHSKKHFGHWSSDKNKRLSVGEKISRANKGKIKHSEEHKRRMSEKLKGNSHTLGHTLTEEHKRKVGESLKKLYENGFAPTKGRKHTKQWKKQMSEKFSGDNNPFAKKVITPYGTFDALITASRQLNLTPYEIRKKLRDKNCFDWSYA